MPSRVEHGLKSIAEEAEGQKGDSQGCLGKEEQPPGRVERNQGLEARVGQQPPGNVGRLHTQTEEREKAFKEHHAGHRQRERDHHGAGQIRHDMPQRIRAGLAPLARAAST